MSQTFWPDQEPTGELLEQARQKEDGAVDKLLERHRDSLHRMIQLRIDQRILRRIDVSDVVQEVLVEVNRRLSDYLNDPSMPFHLWIRQIAKDRLIDAHRRHRASAKRSVDREQGLVLAGANDQSTMELAGQLCDPSLTPAAAATQREIALQVESAIQDLPETDREVILMRHYEHLSNQEVASVLGLNEPAASMRYLRALRRLREQLNAGTSWAQDHVE